MTEVLNSNLAVDTELRRGAGQRVLSPIAIDVGLLADIQRFGALDVSACFSCGNCTVICPLSDNDGTFPRRLIRYGQVGLKDQLLSSKELWTCYHCGLCTDSCPQEADPGEYMAAARRYAIASYDKTHLARTLYTRPVAGVSIAVLVAAFFALFMYSFHGARSSSSLALFGFIPEAVVHWTGVAVMVLMLVAVLAGIVAMASSLAQREDVRLRDVAGGRRAIARSLGELWTALGVESIGQKRFRGECAEAQQPQPLFRRRWLIHALTEWGFLGLLAATMLDYVLALIHVKKTGAVVPLWYPTRLLGTVAGIAMVYGVSTLIYSRLRKSERATTVSKSSDWMFLAMLWLIGVSGFLVELALYLAHAPVWGYWIFLFHVSAALELMLLLPFIKFAHAIYRPVALFFYALVKRRAHEVVQ